MTAPGADSGMVAQLAADLTELRRTLAGRLDAHDQDVAELRSSLAELAQYIADQAEEEAPHAVPVPPSWPDLDPEQAAAAWDALVSWVDGVLTVRYPHAGAQVPPCWPAHPAAVEELSWLHQAWVAAYRHRHRQVRDAADWHDRYLPGALHRIRHDIAAGCRNVGGVASEHQSDSPGPVTSTEHYRDTRQADLGHRRAAADATASP